MTFEGVFFDNSAGFQVLVKDSFSLIFAYLATVLKDTRIRKQCVRSLVKIANFQLLFTPKKHVMKKSFLFKLCVGFFPWAYQGGASGSIGEGGAASRIGSGSPTGAATRGPSCAGSATTPPTS